MRSLGSSVSGPPRYWVAGDPRDLWPREAGFRRWLAGHPGLLADCLGVPGIVFTGQEVPAGERVLSFDVLGRQRWDGGLRADLTARDAAGRVIVVEAQVGEADHDHLGKLIESARCATPTLPTTRSVTECRRPLAISRKSRAIPVPAA